MQLLSGRHITMIAVPVEWNIVSRPADILDVYVQYHSRAPLPTLHCSRGHDRSLSSLRECLLQGRGSLPANVPLVAGQVGASGRRSTIKVYPRVIF